MADDDKLARRTAMKLAMGTVAWAAAGCGEELDLELQPSDDFDDVLDQLHTTSPVFDSGLSNHAPMAAEALVAMGHGDRVVPFVDGYDGRLDPMDPGQPLGDDEWASALGSGSRHADWIATLDEELSGAGDPRDVLLRHWPVLAPGIGAGAFHPFLRVGHAVRSFAGRPTQSRRTEIAHGMGYWFADHQALPGEPGSQPEAGFDVLQALQTLPMVPPELQDHSGYILPRLSQAIDNPDFIAHIERVDLDALPLEQALTQLCAAAARAFVDDGGSSISLLHGITGPSALRLVWDWLDDDGRRLGLAHAFHVAAALISAQAPQPPPNSVAGPTLDLATLIDRCAAADEDHTIKLGEAAAREHAIDPRPEFLAAAELWLD